MSKELDRIETVALGVEELAPENHTTKSASHDADLAAELELGGSGHLQRFEAADDANLFACRVNHSQLGRSDLFIAPDALSYGSSDALYLQNGPAAAGNLFGKLLSNDLYGHCSEIFATARAHGQRI